MENQYPRKKRRKDILDKIAEKLDLPKLLEYDDDSLFDRNIDDYYENQMGKQKSLGDLPMHYGNEELIDKLIMGELLNFGEVEKLLEITLKEFKRTCSMPNKNIEIVFRESSKKNYSKVHKKIGYKDVYRRPYDKENER